MLKMRQFRTENPIILAKEDVSKTPEFYKKGFNDAKILKPYRAHHLSYVQGRATKSRARNEIYKTNFQRRKQQWQR